MGTSASHFGCCGLNHEGSSDAREESGAVWLVADVFDPEVPGKELQRKVSAIALSA